MLGDMQLAALIGKESPALPEGGATEILGLTADSRAVRPGYLFAALPGTRLDGTKFIGQALEMGAAALLVPQGASIEADVPVIADRNPPPPPRAGAGHAGHPPGAPLPRREGGGAGGGGRDPRHARYHEPERRPP